MKDAKNLSPFLITILKTRYRQRLTVISPPPSHLDTVAFTYDCKERLTRKDDGKYTNEPRAIIKTQK